MPHTIPSLSSHLPGMMALGSYRPDVCAHVAALADTVVSKQHPNSTLTPAERELIAAYVSSLNECAYCTTVHAAVASAHLQKEKQEGNTQTQAYGHDAVRTICLTHDLTMTNEKIAALLRVAGQVREQGEESWGD